MMTEQSPQQQLSQLLSALAAGARAVQGLPLGDDLEFQESFPEFAASLSTTRTSLVDALQVILKECSNTDEGDDAEEGNSSTADLLEDPLWWEDCADVCDTLIEQVETILATSNSDALMESLTDWSAQARQKSTNAFGRMVQGTVDMEKPQEVYKFEIDNARRAVFVPSVHPEKPHSIVPLDLSLLPGHGLNTKKDWPKNIVAPLQHAPHVYQAEIEALEYRDWQLQASPPVTRTIPTVEGPLQAKWIDTVEDLQALAAKLEQVQEIALDLEAHSYRSFAGMVCLMQISIRADSTSSSLPAQPENYLVDTLKLHHDINGALAPVLANPDIVKILHGADSDIAWLQRDFGCYIVNLFDTGRASRALQYSSASYAYLLQHYANVTADKSHQLADWRQRPLPEALQQYAIADTHYLLDIYDRLKWDLEQHATASVQSVLDDSKTISLIRYTPEPFLPNGYEKLLWRRRNNKKTTTELNASQTAVLKALWNWRDATARARDESTQYVCTNAALLRLALSMPTTTTALQALFNPMPPLLLEHSVLQCIQQAAALQKAADEDLQGDDDDEHDDEVAPPVGTRSSAFFKPANTEKDTSLRDGIMSPVLGTEALYKQAGWMTPSEHLEEDEMVVTSTTDDDGTGTAADEKPKRLLSISNEDYRSTKTSETGKTADGLGTVRAVRSFSPGDAEQAKQTASDVQAAQKQAIPVVLGMIGSEDTGHVEEERTDPDTATGKDTPNDTDDLTMLVDEEFVIPRSMREIYKISNRNRRNKKAGSPTPERGVTPTNEKEREELAKAEALIRERAAAGYLDPTSGESPGKRPRTKSRTGRESEESVPQEANNTVSSEDDLSFMQEIGWVKDKDEAAQLMKRRYGKGKSSDEPSTEDNEGGSSPSKQPYAAFDYSSSVGVMPTTQAANPFFSGAAVTGGPLAQGFGKPARKNTGQSGSGNKNKQYRGRQERPEKKDGRSHAYRKR